MKENVTLTNIEALCENLSGNLSHDDYFEKTKTRSCLLINEFIETIPSGNGPVLEIGAFRGHNVIILKEIGYDSHAVDIEEVVRQDSIQKNYAGYDVPLHPYRVGEAEKIPYPDNFFSAILIIEVLEHLTCNPLYLFSEMKRVLKPGGQILLTTPNQVRLRGRIKVLLGISTNDDPARLVKSFRKEGGMDDSGYHWKLYTVAEVKLLAFEAGLIIKRIDYRWVPESRQRSFDSIYRVIEKTIGLFFPSCRDWLTFWLQKPRSLQN